MINEMEIQPHAICRQFLLEGLSPGMHVLDVGFGHGELMSELSARGHSMAGVEIDDTLVQAGRSSGLDVKQGSAENLPFGDASFDAIVCSVVLPCLKNERAAVREWARVLRPGGVVNATFHGIGYGFNYLFGQRNWKKKFFGFRMLANTLAYGISGCRLPGFLGDTLCQRVSWMKSHYCDFGLTLEREQVAGVTLGAPRFLCHRLLKP